MIIENSMHFNARISLTNKPREILNISEQIILELKFLNYSLLISLLIILKISLFVTVPFSNCLVSH